LAIVELHGNHEGFREDIILPELTS